MWLLIKCDDYTEDSGRQVLIWVPIKEKNQQADSSSDYGREVELSTIMTTIAAAVAAVDADDSAITMSTVVQQSAASAGAAVDHNAIVVS